MTEDQLSQIPLNNTKDGVLGAGFFEVLKVLTELPGPSGYEHRVQSWLEERWQAAGCQTHRSKIGNLFACVGGQGPRLLIGAHSDEIGFLVKNIDERGHLLITSNTLGSDLILPNTSGIGHVHQIMTPNGDLEGVVGSVTGHIMTRKQREANVIDWHDIFVDIGARSKKEAMDWGVRIGSPIVVASKTRRIGHNIVGKAMDDRAALAIMTHWIENLDLESLQYELWLVSTVQEEIGLVGAESVQDFDYAIAMEVGLAGDIPPVDEINLPSCLGLGPLIGHKDAQVHYDVDLIQKLEKSAEKSRVAVQHLVFPQFSSDGRKFMGNDIPTALLAYPTRYTHTPFETVDERDLFDTMQLLTAFVATPE